jgi:hypothetical protein
VERGRPFWAASIAAAQARNRIRSATTGANSINIIDTIIVQLLILNAGDGYHVLLAGMERISVDLGQFVVTGEPVAVMGGEAQSTAARAGAASQPVLYVEFRKDGVPVDPGPWWAANEGQKVRG